MKRLPRAASTAQASTTMTIDVMFKQMKADGVDVIDSRVREPNFSTPDNIKAAGIAVIEQNVTRYIPTVSTVRLRQVVCGRMKADYGLGYKPSRMVVSSGAKHLIYLALRVVVNPGDEVTLPAPYQANCIELIKMVGGVPVVVTATEAEYLKLTAEKLSVVTTSRTKAILLNNPPNSTDMMHDQEELEAIAAACIQADIYVISDEICACLAYDGRTSTSFAFLNADAKERTILVSDVSKVYTVTGWRIGYACANDVIAKVVVNYVSHSTGSPVAISQRTAAAILSSSQAEIEIMHQASEQRRNYIVERVNAIPGVSCIQPEGAFYVTTNLEQPLGKIIHEVEIINDDVFADTFLKYGLVAVVPGSGLGAPNLVR